MIKAKPTVTVALSAFNEELNVDSCLRSILAQNETGFILEKILVVSDGSTDDTVAAAGSIKSLLVEIWPFRKRVGQSARLNQIYRKVKSDILVQTDADVIWNHPLVLKQLIHPIKTNSRVGICGGNPQPFLGMTWMEKAANTTIAAYNLLRPHLRAGHNVYSAQGRLLAFRKDLLKQSYIPGQIVNNDTFMYFTCLTKGFSYRFVQQALVNYSSPSTLSDHIRQNTRYLLGPLEMEQYFPRALVRQEYTIPRRLWMKSLLKVFVKHPLPALTIFFINRYCQLKVKLKLSSVTSKWEVSSTTKSIGEKQKIRLYQT